MNYSKELEFQKKCWELGQEEMALVTNILEQNILSLNFEPGSLYWISRDNTLKFDAQSQGKAVSGTIYIDYNEVVKKHTKISKVVNKLILYVEGSTKFLNLSFDNNLNIIACEASSLNENSNERRFLKFDKSQNLVKINYYDREATGVVDKYLVSNHGSRLIWENLYALNGLLPDRKTEIEVGSREELSNIISSFWENAELSEEKYRGFSKKYPSFSKV